MHISSSFPLYVLTTVPISINIQPKRPDVKKKLQGKTSRKIAKKKSKTAVEEVQGLPGKQKKKVSNTYAIYCGSKAAGLPLGFWFVGFTLEFILHIWV